jgi:uncharacterized membrane protein YGL010W
MRYLIRRIIAGLNKEDLQLGGVHCIMAVVLSVFSIECYFRFGIVILAALWLFLCIVGLALLIFPHIISRDKTTRENPKEIMKES